MYIYWNDTLPSLGHMRKILDNESWELYCDYDEHGNSFLKLKIGEDIHCVCEDDIWTSGRPKLDSLDVADYFTDVVNTVFELVVKDAPEYIDLVKIQDQVIESHWELWKKRGYVED